LFHTGGAPGIRPSEFSPSERYPDVSARKHPLTVEPSGTPAAVAAGRPDRPRFLGFGPFGSPWRPREVLTHRPLAPPLGLTLRRHFGKSLGRDFARPPLPRFTDPTYPAEPPAPQSIHRLLLSLFRKMHCRAPPGKSGPLRVFAPAQSRAFRRPFPRAMRSPHMVPRITAG